LALTISGCAQQRALTWSRADGKPFAAEQIDLDRTICRGEMQKANLASNAEAGFARGRAVREVFVGCMAQRGYMQVPAD